MSGGSGDVEVASFDDAWDSQARAEFGDLGPAEVGRPGGGDRGGAPGRRWSPARRPALTARAPIPGMPVKA